MPDCEQSINDIPVSAAQPAATDKVLITRANGTSYLMAWSVLVNWLGGGTPVTPPTANAGGDGVITLPTSSTTLTGSGTGGSGTITSYSWTKVSGPAGGTIASPNSASTNVTGLGQGTYIFRLTVTNSNNQTAQDDVAVTVNTAAPANFAAQWGWFASDPYTGLLSADALTYQGSGNFTQNGNIVADFSAAPVDRYYVVRFPATEPDKTHYVNTAVFIEGDIPDSVFRAIFTTGSFKYIVSRTPQTFDPNPTTFS